jgi:hypothetical protein
MKRQTGDKYRPIVRIKKMKKGIATVIEVSGQTYTLQHKDHIRSVKK